jgi:hypothetical protein
MRTAGAYRAGRRVERVHKGGRRRRVVFVPNVQSPRLVVRAVRAAADLTESASRGHPRLDVKLHRTGPRGHHVPSIKQQACATPRGVRHPPARTFWYAEAPSSSVGMFRTRQCSPSSAASSHWMSTSRCSDTSSHDTTHPRTAALDAAAATGAHARTWCSASLSSGLHSTNISTCNSTHSGVKADARSSPPAAQLRTLVNW